MKYTGRIVMISIITILILATRIYGSLYYNFPMYQFPLIGLFAIVISWLLGTQFDRLKFLSEKDYLTSLYNRRFMLHAFPKLISLVNRKQEKLILYFIDVDNFKVINDTCGHEIGDQVLKRIASILIQHSQKKDIVVRWAGDEFLILSPFSNDHNRSMMMSRIHSELKLVSQEFNLAISVSIGTAIYPNNAHTIDELLHIADQEMYTLKPGRNEIAN